MRRPGKSTRKGSKAQRQRALRRRNAPKAARSHKTYGVDASKKIMLLELKLNESLEQQTATSEVLKVISRSGGQLEPVFNAMLENAVQICGAKFGQLFLFEEDGFRTTAMHDVPRAFVEKRRREPFFRPSAGSPLGRVMRTRQVAHIVDVTAEQGYAESDQALLDLAKLGGARTTVAVPMLNGNELVGALSIYHKEIHPFTDRQIELLNNFAAQAVIAIENARLLNELRESLEQQTATSEVLKVISSSPGELDPVFNAMLEHAVRICDAGFGGLWLYDGSAFHVGALYHVPPEFTEFWKRGPHPPSPQSTMARVVRTKRTAEIADLKNEPGYAKGDPLVVAGVDVAGIRSFILVPMLKEGELIGAIGVYQQEVRPFTEKQVALVTNFAAQAVIAIENTRLLGELRESLQQQTATADVLKIISSSSGDLEPVFSAMLENATRICGAHFGSMLLREGEAFRRVALYNAPEEFVKFHLSSPRIPIENNQDLRRFAEAKQPVHLADLAAMHPDDPIAKYGGARTLLAVPMVKDDDLIGMISIYRQEVHSFADKQIELVQNFAAQAVIAIENARLLNELRSRTHELAASLDNLRTTQDRLVQTQKLASLGQLTAGIAHEIKNPLNFVNNFSGVSAELVDELQEILKDSSPNEKIRSEAVELMNTLRGNLDKVVQHGQRADAIVKNMLLHSHQGSGEHRLIAINALVEESLKLAYHGARAEKQNFNIMVEQSFDPVAGEADIFPQEITRVLLNLISNGVYATRNKTLPDGEIYKPTLIASTKDLGDRVEIKIRDNGTGIPPEVREKMFNPFFTTKPAGEGTGLGLSISHDIVVKQHGGTIDVDTRPGEFTEIRIILPRAAALILDRP